MPRLCFAYQLRGDSRYERNAGVWCGSGYEAVGHGLRHLPRAIAFPARNCHMMRVVVIHGPNLNLLGEREPQIYGNQALHDIDAEIIRLGGELRIEVNCAQFNSEGDIIDALHAARADADAVLLNPGAYGHYSYGITDAIVAIGIPVIEVHLSNTQAREAFRRTSVIAPVCTGSISGFGSESYLLALRAVAALKSRG